jgi:hypothetical protein
MVPDMPAPVSPPGVPQPAPAKMPDIKSPSVILAIVHCFTRSIQAHQSQLASSEKYSFCTLTERTQNVGSTWQIGGAGWLQPEIQSESPKNRIRGLLQEFTRAFPAGRKINSAFG